MKDYFRINHKIYLLEETKKAKLFLIDEKEYWIPESLIRYNSDDRLLLPLWFIRKMNFQVLEEK